jgi:hypothetical protein
LLNIQNSDNIISEYDNSTISDSDDYNINNEINIFSYLALFYNYILFASNINFVPITRNSVMYSLSQN